ncbi:hypothetical protein [Pseudomonas schmalbachii]|uniref:Cation transporter n=1 Tax=Pseudomonas schmalbachii TaxID=2816993 RepID=A0ABS3TJT3_9PSED|nr:hypothetical protein [Pseudomonas schmalbachii]MBO3273920.1 hypothetical protein [Pseudomonas schmalbachii]
MVGFETLLLLVSRVRVVHHIRGRIRLKLIDADLPVPVPARLPDRSALRRAHDIAARTPGVRSLRLNPLARSCAVEYDPSIIPDQAWSDFLAGSRSPAAGILEDILRDTYREIVDAQL